MPKGYRRVIVITVIAGQRIMSPNSRTTPSLTKHNKPIFSGIVSRQSQLRLARDRNVITSFSRHRGGRERLLVMGLSPLS